MFKFSTRTRIKNPLLLSPLHSKSVRVERAGSQNLGHHPVLVVILHLRPAADALHQAVLHQVHHLHQAVQRGAQLVLALAAEVGTGDRDGERLVAPLVDVVDGVMASLPWPLRSSSSAHNL